MKLTAHYNRTVLSEVPVAEVTAQNMISVLTSVLISRAVCRLQDRCGVEYSAVKRKVPYWPDWMGLNDRLREKGHRTAVQVLVAGGHFANHYRLCLCTPAFNETCTALLQTAEEHKSA